MSSRLSPSDAGHAWRPVSPELYRSAYRGERYRAPLATRKTPWRARLRTGALLLVLAVAAFWVVRLAIWGFIYWRGRAG